MEKIKIRVDLPEENRVLYASCVDKEGFVDVNRFIEERVYPANCGQAVFG